MAKSTFVRKFRQNLKRMAKTLEAYLADAENENKMHDVRTSVRRLEATFRLMPKKARRRYRRRIEKYREFLEVSSRTRDCDVIVGRVATLGALDTSDLEKEKKAELSKAIRLARSLQKLPPMRLPQDDG
jgi:CHAD domain-containing protein